jgi:hypothetical protein
MALPATTAAYEDCYDYYERARGAPNGIRVLLADRAQAQHLQFRMHQARALERRDSMRIYDKVDPRWGKSENDHFKVSLVPPADGDTGYWVYIQPWGQQIEAVEEL